MTELPTTPTPPHMPTPAAAPAASRLLPLLMLVLLCAAPSVVAWVFYLQPDILPAKRTAHGNLIQPPRPLRHVELRAAAGDRFAVERLAHDWSLLWVTAAPRDEGMLARLQSMRNIRLALRQDGARLHLYVVATDSGRDAAWFNLAQRFPEATLLSGSAQDVRSLAGDDGSAKSGAPSPGTGFVVVDPLGNAMMHYADDTPPKFILKDLERLLKYSQIGR